MIYSLNKTITVLVQFPIHTSPFKKQNRRLTKKPCNYINVILAIMKTILIMVVFIIIITIVMKIILITIILFMITIIIRRLILKLCSKLFTF